jgi:shikimate kinase
MPLASGEAVVLTGMMASGKSTVARLLGRYLRRRVVSTDVAVERLAGKPIARIFAEEGEAAFRALERRVVGGLRGPLVVDLGGGGFCDPASAARLLATSRVVFLDVSAREAGARLARGEAGTRPLAAAWSSLLARRLPLYRRAHHVVPVDGSSPEAVARRVLDLLARGAPW